MISRCLLLAGLLLTAPALAQPVQIELSAVAFEASTTSRHAARYASWMPLLVELTAEGTQPRQVQIRYVSPDIDGDLVAYTETPIVLTPNTPPRRVWLYVLPEADSARPGRIQVQNMDGQPLAESDPVLFDPVSGNHQLIVDLSASQISALQILDAGGDYYGPFRERDYQTNRCVARLEADKLPDRWYGLEAVNVLVWDAPETLPSLAQQDALVEWVRRGGQLVLGIGPAWSQLSSSRLAPLLPYAGEHELVQTDALPLLAERTGRDRETFTPPIPIARVERRGDADLVFRDRLLGRPHDLIAQRNFGAGRVIASTTRLRDLLRGANEAELRATLPLLFDLTPISTRYHENETEQFMTTSGVALRNALLTPTEFRGQASLLVLGAFVFVGLYILGSTWASWGWLVNRKLTQASWVVFAGIAIVASLLSVAAVQLIRGTSDSLHTLAFVDLEAGSSAARARVWAGYRSARARTVDLQLDSETGFLRGAAKPAGSPTYETPERYVAEATRGIIRDAPLRATLKQFDGWWEGPADGMIRAQLVASRRTGQLTPESWIANDTPLGFSYGYLLYVDPRVRYLDQVVARPTGLHDRQAYWGAATYPPAVNVLALELGQVAAGATIRELGADAYEKQARDEARWAGRDSTQRKPHEEPMMPTLWHLQNLLWTNSFRVTPFGNSIDPTAAAALLHSTRALYLPNKQLGNFEAVGLPVSSELLPGADVTHWLTGGTEGQAVLLLYTSRPAAPGLVRNGTALQARRGAALYRVRIPIRWSN